MRKKLFIFVAIVISAVITVCQLPVNSMALDDESVIPDAYPEMTVLMLKSNLEYESDTPETEETKTPFKSPVDFTDESYDYFELDFYVESDSASETVRLSLYDSMDKVSTYSFLIAAGAWNHLKLRTSDFLGNADFTEISGYRIECPKAGVRYKAVNLCFTGIKQPENQAKGDVVNLKHRIDFTDESKNSTRSEIYYFEDITNINIYSKDWIEFDLFVSGESTGTISPTVILVDSDYTSSSKTDNQCYYKVSLDLGKWNHFKVSARDFKTYNNKNCDFNQIVGVCISSPKDNHRYVMANLCLTKADETAPEIQGERNILKKGIFIEAYSLVDNSKTNIAEFDSIIDFSAEDHMNLSIYIDSSFSNTQKISINLFDVDNNASSFNITVSPLSWVDVKIPVYVFENSNISLDKICGIYLSGLDKFTRYFAANLYLSSLNTDFEISFPNDAVNLEGIEFDYVKEPDDVYDASKISFPEIDISGYDQIQIDMMVDTPVDSLPLSETLEIALLDKNNAEYVVTFNYTNNILLDDIKANLSILTGVDKLEICGIYIKNAADYYHYMIKNISFIKIIPPDISENTEQGSVLQPAPIVECKDFTVTKTYNIPIKFDNNAVIDITQADYIELDVYIVIDESRKDYEDSIVFTLYLCDETYASKNYGRVTASGLSVKANAWNHLKIPVDSFSTDNGWNGNKKALISFMVESQKSGLRYIVANICRTVNKSFRNYNGVYPNNVTDFKIDEALDWDVSTGFWNTYTKLEPTVNVQDADYIKFDIFCFSQKGETDRIQFSFGNCDKYEWGRRGFALVSVKTNQWNTVKIKVEDLNVITLGLDLDLANASMYSVDSADKISERIVIKKLCTVKRVTTVEKDSGTKPSKPDSNSRYISDCESVNSDIGIWTSITSYLTTDYKTEGESSIAARIENTDNDSLNSIRFLFYSFADFSSAKTVRFDLFIDDAKLAEKCGFNIIFSGDKRGLSKNYTYNLDKTLNSGWNTIEIGFEDFKADSEADLKTIQTVMLKVEVDGLSDDDYFIVGLDNLRVNKSFILSNEIVQNSENPNTPDDNAEINSSAQPIYDTVYEEAEIIMLEPEENTIYTKKQIIKKQKVVLNAISSFHWMVMAAAICVSGVLISSSTVLLIKNRIPKKKGD